MVYKASNTPTVPIPAEPMILHTLLTNANTNADVIVYVPWKSCKLVFAYSTVVTAVHSGGMVLTLELNAAAGSAMYTVTIAGSAPVGAIDEGTKPSSINYDAWHANRGQLDRDNTSRDAINVDIAGASATGQVWLTMYFEHDYAVGYY